MDEGADSPGALIRVKLGKARFSLKEVLTMKRISILALCGVALLATVVAPALSSAASADKPRIAVLEFKNKADNQWWYHGGATAAQDVFVTELVKSGKFRVVEREQLEAMMQEK